MKQETATTWAALIFVSGLIPYAAFWYLLSRPQNEAPKGLFVAVGSVVIFMLSLGWIEAFCQEKYGSSFVSVDFLHGSASILYALKPTIMAITFQQAVEAKEKGLPPPPTTTSQSSMWGLVIASFVFSVATVYDLLTRPAAKDTPYLGGVLDLPWSFERLGATKEPEGALSVLTWMLHMLPIFEYVAAIDFCWQYADAVGNQAWKGFSWALLIMYCNVVCNAGVHLFYTTIPELDVVLAIFGLVGYSAEAYAALKMSRASARDSSLRRTSKTSNVASKLKPNMATRTSFHGDVLVVQFKIFAVSTLVAYLLKYGMPFFRFPHEQNLVLGLLFILVPSALMTLKHYSRSLLNSD